MVPPMAGWGSPVSQWEYLPLNPPPKNVDRQTPVITVPSPFLRDTGGNYSPHSKGCGMVMFSQVSVRPQEGGWGYRYLSFCSKVFPGPRSFPVGYPRQHLEVPPTQDKDTAPARIGVPPSQDRGGVPPPPTAKDGTDVQRGWYASCVHAGGLSCIKINSPWLRYILLFFQESLIFHSVWQVSIDTTYLKSNNKIFKLAGLAQTVVSASDSGAAGSSLTAAR